MFLFKHSNEYGGDLSMIAFIKPEFKKFISVKKGDPFLTTIMYTI